MRKMLFAAIVGTTMAAAQAGAQPVQPVAPAAPVAPAPGAHFGGRMQGDLTRQQAQLDADALFQRYDINHDGTVTRDEAQQALAQWAASHGGGDSGEGAARAQRMLDRMFGDAQSVTQQQFEAQALARFDRQDLDHNGVVTQAERQQGWRARSQ